jgi:dephospho-CoA kinase
MRYAVGLTGGIGCGKSTVADRFASRGVAVVDADAIAHRLSASGGAAISALRDAFGARFITRDGALDRTAMREHVFANDAERARLEGILHPMIRAASDAERAAAASPYVLMVVPLLLEKRGRPVDIQRVLVVTCEQSVQIARVIQRSAMSVADVERIIATQMPQSEKVQLADDVIDNSGVPAALDAPIETLHRRYVEAALRFDPSR